MTSLLIATDIFGRCDGLQCLCADLAGADIHFRIVDPYHGQFQRFTSEIEAYAAFTARGGHDVYAELVRQALSSSIDIAIGFSAGASALWRALGKNSNHVQLARLYYPGQLHSYYDVTPKQPTQLIFGNKEQHFNIDDLCLQLANDSHVWMEKTPWQHGFMNPMSNSFNNEGYQQQVCELRQILTDIRLVD